MKYVSFRYIIIHLKSVLLIPYTAKVEIKYWKRVLVHLFICKVTVS